MEKGTEKEEYWNHGLGFISYLIRSKAGARSMIPGSYGVLATDTIDGTLQDNDLVSHGEDLGSECKAGSKAGERT